MECNKEGAMKAKELAEKKILENDLAGAKTFALEAQELCPDLGGLPQLLEAIEVYVSAERRINGQVDWYGVLGVDPMADDETIRRSHRKLALTLHPDKNKSIGAEGAFNLISQAWNLLSDREKKISYDQKLKPWSIYEETPYGKPSVPVGGNDFYNPFNSANQKDRDPKSSSAHPNPPQTPSVIPKKTFWTMCSSCTAKFEYLSAYLNRRLACKFCDRPFIAFEIPAPSIYRNTSSTSRGGTGKTPAKHQSETSDTSSPFSMPSGTSRVPTSISFSGRVPNVIRVSSENLKRGHEDKTPPVMMKEALFGKTQAVKITDAGSAFQSSCHGSNSVPERDRPRKKENVDKCREEKDRKEKESAMASHNEGKSMGDEHGNCKHNNGGMKDMTRLEIREMLMDKARKEIRMKLDEFEAASILMNLDKSRNTNKKAKEKGEKRSVDAVKSGAQEREELVDSETRGEKSSSTDTDIPVAETTDFLSMIVPDPDFHDFDNDRTEKAFGKNQVWAIYDDDDGMPRSYALIHDVISLRPFKMKISWLNSKSNDELASAKWIGSGFHKTSGDFRRGKREFNGSVNSFSHRVNWTKGYRGVIKIYPKKGDVWALYRNWSPDWNEMTPDEIVHEYDMVVVLESYNEERGVGVAPLVKVAGFKTVFRRHEDPRSIRNIPRAEMFRLSHQVPSYLLNGQEGVDAPRGCLELDPAALPLELVQVVTEAPEPGTEMTIEEASADPVGPRKNSGEDEEAKAFQMTKEKDSAEDISREAAVAEAPKKKGNMPENWLVYKRKRTSLQGKGERREAATSL